MAAASRQLEEQLENNRQNLPAELMQLRTKMQYYQPFAAADALLRRYNNDLLAVPAVVYRQYTMMYPHDLYTLTNLYATACLSNNAFEAADSLLNKALSIDSTYAVALRLKIAVKQELHQPDSALLYCNRMLAINRECVTAMAAKARILLRKGDKREGLSLATQSFLLDSTNGYAMATLAIAYHCNRRFRERDALMLRALTDSVLNSYMQYAKDVASGRESFFIK
jgi:tetratricopeptide (TPR) repeat protein